MKRIVTIQDISCLGKCSLTVALPIISAMGVEAAIIPTAVLSTHTMFEGFTCKDIDDQIVPITDHWKELGIKFDGIYTGYLASEAQIQTVMSVIEKLKDNTVVVVDPAMADNGKLYPAFDEAFPKEMAKLCGIADIILPNITEACFMTGTEYKDKYDENYVFDLVKKLAALGCKKVILKGVVMHGSYGVLIYDCVANTYRTYFHERIPVGYHGTGDIFSSAFVGALMGGKEFEESVKIAADYVVECIRITAEREGSNWYGVDFETAIPFLVDKMRK